jgi:hypothetical protein
MGMPAGPMGGADAEKRPALVVKLVQETEDGPPLTSRIREIVLTGAGRTIHGNRQQSSPDFGPMGFGSSEEAERWKWATASGNGKFNFDNLEPDRYELKITLADGQYSTQPVLIRNDKPQELTVICPSPRKKVPVLITVPPLPEDLQKAGCILQLELNEAYVELGGNKWLNGKWEYQTIRFNTATGQVCEIQLLQPNSDTPRVINLQEANPEDRAVFRFTGPTLGRFEIYWPLSSTGQSFGTFSWPNDGSYESTRTVEPGENHWELELPEELIAATRKKLAELKLE